MDRALKGICVIALEQYMAGPYCSMLLADAGAEAVILVCTEIPLALPESNYNSIPLIGSTAILARVLILNSNPDSLKK